MNPIGSRPRRVLSRAALAVLGCLLLALAWCSLARSAPKPNIILIVVDALRPDHLGCYGYGLPTSPVIDRLAADGTVFETAISQASWTKASFASLLTSRYPFQTGVTDWFSVLPDTVPTLQETLAAEGYETTCVINMVGLAGKFGLLRGFAKADVADKYERRDRETTDAALGVIAEARQPFFALIHYFGAHDPYRPSRESLELVAPDLAAANPAAGASDGDSAYRADDAQETSGKAAFDVRLYDACIRDIDAEIGRVVAFLDQHGLAANTVVIVTADHGEAFKEHGRYSHGWSLFDEEIMIPLVVKDLTSPAQAPRRSFQARSIDIFPTVLDLAGMDPPAGLEGRDLFGPERAPAPDVRPFFPPEVAYCETSMREAVPYLKAARTLERKAVVEPATGAISIYDLRADPREADDLWPDRVDSRDALLKMLSSVPGFSVKGWRLGFTGATNRDEFEATITLPAGARIVDADKVASRGRFDIKIAADRRSLHVAGTTRDLNLVVFDTEPEDAELEVTIKAGSATSHGTTVPGLYVGRRTKQRPGEPFKITARAATGMPITFEECRQAHTSAAFLWWAPGQKISVAAPPANLSPEEEKRLRALGYIQ
jgi:arylsulfatase A-like enzyme